MNKKKVYFVTSELPGRFGGSNSRNFNMLKFINKSKFEISLFTLFDENRKTALSQVENELKIPIYKVQSKKIHMVFKLFTLLYHKIPPSMQRFDNNKLSEVLLNQVFISKPDIIQLQQITAYYAIRKIIPKLKEMGIKLILDEHNVENIAFLESISSMNLIQQMLGRYILPSYKKMEVKALIDMHYVLACSDIDKKILSKYISQKNFTTIPNGVDCNYFKYKPNAASHKILFMGGIQYPPNEEALRFYLKKVHGEIKAKYPFYKLYILGSKPNRWLKDLALKDNSIIIHGYVEDVRDYLSIAAICICPILTGSGTRLKILEYLASGKAVVSTAKGAEGINITNIKELMIVNQDSEFISRIDELLSNPKKILSIGKNGRLKMESEYDWKAIVIKLENTYNALSKD